MYGVLAPLRGAMQTSAAVNCLSNQEQLGHAFLVYATDYDGRLPLAWHGRVNQDRPGGWICYRSTAPGQGPRIDAAAGSLDRYVAQKASYHCGLDRHEEGCSFGVNALLFPTPLVTGAHAGMPLAQIRHPERVVLLLEEDDGDGTSDDGWMDPVMGRLAARHNGFGNVVFADGHGGSLEPDEAREPDGYGETRFAPR